MTPMDLSAALAAEHSRDLAREAQASRLAALARCCRPATWRRAAARLGDTAAALRPPRLARARRDEACCVA